MQDSSNADEAYEAACLKDVLMETLCLADLIQTGQVLRFISVLNAYAENGENEFNLAEPGLVALCASNE